MSSRPTWTSLVSRRIAEHVLVYKFIGKGAGTMPHTPACRARIVEERMKTSAGAARVARMIQRQTRYISEQIANQDVRGQGAEAAAAAADGVPFSVSVVPPAA